MGVCLVVRSTRSTWRRRLPLALLATLAALVVGCGAQSEPSQAAGSPSPLSTASAEASAPAASPLLPHRWPTDAWQTAAPETRGFDSTVLAEGLQQLAEHGNRMHSLLIVRGGTLVLDAYAYPYDGSTYHDLASVTKSITTTLIGIAADQGLLDLDAPMVSFFPDRTIANRSARKEQVTVRQLASNTSGLDCRVGDREITLEQMRTSGDWVQFVLDLDVRSEPGTTFAYCSPGMHLLSAILSEATGMSALDFARQNLFGPLGITDVYWPADDAGNSHGWGDLALHPRDAAKIGLLFLAQGRWDDAQVVSPEWVAAATVKQAETLGYKAEDYGYGWWISRPSIEPTPFFRADGNGGQRIVGIPDLDIVIVTTGGGFSLEQVTPIILASVTDDWQPLPANPDGEALLQAAVAALAAGPEAQPVAELPAAAATLSDRTIRFEDPRVTALVLHFEEGAAEATATLDVVGEPAAREMVIGLDNRWRPSLAGRPIVARGAWTDATTFAIEVDEGPGVGHYTLRVRFEGELPFLDLVGIADEVITVAGHF